MYVYTYIYFAYIFPSKLKEPYVFDGAVRRADTDSSAWVFFCFFFLPCLLAIQCFDLCFHLDFLTQRLRRLIHPVYYLLKYLLPEVNLFWQQWLLIEMYFVVFVKDRWIWRFQTFSPMTLLWPFLMANPEETKHQKATTPKKNPSHWTHLFLFVIINLFCPEVRTLRGWK